MRHTFAALSAAALLLAACSSDDSADPGPQESPSADATTEGKKGGIAVPTSEGTDEPTAGATTSRGGAAATTAPTTGAGETNAALSCEPDDIAGDLREASEDFTIQDCDGSWGVITFEGDDESDTTVIQARAGTWAVVGNAGTGLCKEDMEDAGAPEFVYSDLDSCQGVDSGSQSGSLSGCVITSTLSDSNLRAEGSNVTCDDVQKAFGEAEAMGEPTDSQAVRETPGGWQCTVSTKTDADVSGFAGACSKKDDSTAYFTLYPTG